MIDSGSDKPGADKPDTGKPGIFRSVGDLLATDSALGKLARAADRQIELADCVRRQLPADLAGAVTACNLRPDGTLVVTTAGPEWASRLRFEGGTILAGCRKGWPAAARVQVRVGRNRECRGDGNGLPAEQ